MITRQKRLEKFRESIKQSWFDYFWDTILNYFRLESVSFSNLSRNPNITLERILQNPIYPWSYDELSGNPNINFIIVKNTPYIRWNYKILSLNPSITWFDITSHLDLPWDWRNLAEKEGITIDIIRLKFDDLNPKLLIHNPSVTLEMIENNLDLDWDWNEIPMKEDLTILDILKVANKYNITLARNHWIAISFQKNVFWQTVMDYPNLNWNYECLSANPNITFEIIQKNTNYSWSWKHFSYNPNFKLEYILRLPKVNWDWEYISENCLTPVFFKKHPDFPYCYNSIQMNQLFSFQNVIEHPIIFPNMNYLSLNPAIKLQDIRENRGYTWDWFWLSGSYFNFDKDAFFLKKARQWMAAYKIQQWFYAIKHNPKLKYGRKHINKLYLENFDV